MAQATVHTPGTTSPASDWRVWVPCAGMALCSWLSFVDRGVLGVLSPTILKDTGMSGQDYGNVVFFFFVAYTIANPLWGSILDHVGLRVGMLLAVALWTAASASHAWMSGFVGFAMARALLGLGEGATFPGGLRTAVESLPPNLRARGIATSFSGGTIGAIVTPLMMVPIAVTYGWRKAFIVTGALGIAWLVVWTAIARPPYLPTAERRSSRLAWPNPFERRFWSLVFSYALPAIAPGPVLNLMPIYLTRGLGVSQADLAGIFWTPPAAWGLGYFVGGWAADRFAADTPRPVGMFVVLAICSLAFGLAPIAQSVPIAIGLMALACFIGGWFQMLSLKVGSYAYPREQAAMMSGIASGSWSLLNAVLAAGLLWVLPPGLRGQVETACGQRSPDDFLLAVTCPAVQGIGRLFDQQRWGDAFWLIALLPTIGIAAWLLLSRTHAGGQADPSR